jgi:hypothetical protein
MDPHFTHTELPLLFAVGLSLDGLSHSKEYTSVLPWHMIVRRSASMQWSKSCQQEPMLMPEDQDTLTQVSMHVIKFRLCEVLIVILWVEVMA